MTAVEYEVTVVDDSRFTKLVCTSVDAWKATGCDDTAASDAGVYKTRTVCYHDRHEFNIRSTLNGPVSTGPLTLGVPVVKSSHLEKKASVARGDGGPTTNS